DSFLPSYRASNNRSIYAFQPSPPLHSPHPLSCFFFHDPATTQIYTLSLHDALPISRAARSRRAARGRGPGRSGGRARGTPRAGRSEEHTSELQSRGHLVCRLLLEKKKSTSVCRPSASVASMIVVCDPAAVRFSGSRV